VPLCPLQIPHDLTRACTRAAAIFGLSKYTSMFCFFVNGVVQPASNVAGYRVNDRVSVPGKGRDFFRPALGPSQSPIQMAGVRSWLLTPTHAEIKNACSLVCWTFLRPWRWRRYVPPKRRLLHNGLHGVISQRMILFITTAVKISNPTYFRISSIGRLLWIQR
jgi:hypothetical protein